jgi:hypothetical protein
MLLEDCKMPDVIAGPFGLLERRANHPAGRAMEVVMIERPGHERR